jgi:Flp pilus assembly protein TadD
MTIVRSLPRWCACLLLAACGGTTTPATAPAGSGASEVGAPPSLGGSERGGGQEKGGGPEVDRAILAIKASDYKSAKAALEQALQKTPKNGTALYYLGVCLENLGDKKGAEQKYKDALENAPDLAEAAVNLGALYLDSNRWDEAVAVTEKALLKRPDDPALHTNMAVALRGKGDKHGALVHYEKAVRVVGDNADLRYGYGSLLMEMGDKARAASELKAALASAGSNRSLLASIGRLLGPAGAFADCVAAFDKAIAAGDDAEMRVRRGLCRHSLKDEAGARADFEGAIKLDTKFAPAHYYLGESFSAQGQFEKAAKEFDAAAQAQPTSDLGKKAKAQAEEARKSAKKGKK